MTGYDYYLFDFDGTIGDTKACILHSFRKTFETHNMPPAHDDDVAALIGVPLMGMFPVLSPVELSPDQINAMIATYRGFYESDEIMSQTKLFPGMREVLEQLKKNGKGMAIVTSKLTPVVRHNMQFLGIEELFDVVVGADMVAGHKPQPDTVYKALEMLGVVKSDWHKAVVIGDTTFDLDMAKNAGLNCWAVTWGAHAREKLEVCEPERVIERVLDF